MTTTTKTVYSASATLTITLASLASDSNLLAGRQSTEVDNTSDSAIDVIVTGKITTGTSPTVGNTIEVWAWSQLDDTPTRPDVIGASDAAASLTSTNVKYAGAFKLGAVIIVDGTTARTYPFSFSLAQLFGGLPPKKWGVWVVNGTGAALNSTGGNHVVSKVPVQLQNV